MDSLTFRKEITLDRSVQIQTDPLYFEFLDRAVEREFPDLISREPADVLARIV